MIVVWREVPEKISTGKEIRQESPKLFLVGGTGIQKRHSRMTVD
jgi:hypothetical protein